MKINKLFQILDKGRKYEIELSFEDGEEVLIYDTENTLKAHIGFDNGEPYGQFYILYLEPNNKNYDSVFSSLSQAFQVKYKKINIQALKELEMFCEKVLDIWQLDL